MDDHALIVNVPFAREMFGDNGNKPFKTTQDGPMNDHGPLRRSIGICHFICSTILEIETFRQLEVELDQLSDLRSTDKAVAGR